MESPRGPDRCGGHGHARIRGRHGRCRARRRNGRWRHGARHPEGGTASTGEAETTGSSASQDADLLDGGPGTDRLWGGAGADRLVARDKTQDLVVCGSGRDVAIVDLLDLVHRSCETVRRPQASTDSQPPEPPAVVTENAKPGTSGWASFDRAPARAIEGYTEPSAAPGEPLTFHVSTVPEASYRILIYRAGYYGGVGARRVACLPSCDGAADGHERSIPIASPEGLVHAGWPVSQQLEIPNDWVSGYYFAHFQLTSGPNAGRVTTTWFIVREPAGGARRRSSSRRPRRRGRPTTAGAAAASTNSTARTAAVPRRSRSIARTISRSSSVPNRSRFRSSASWSKAATTSPTRPTSTRRGTRSQSSVERSSPSRDIVSTGRRARATASMRHAEPESTSPSSARTRPTGRSDTRTTSVRSSATRARTGTPRPIPRSRRTSSAGSCLPGTSVHSWGSNMRAAC